MAPSFKILLFSSTVTISIFLSNAAMSFRPKALVLPVSKDASTLQYVTNIKQRTPFVSVKVVVDLGGRFLWVDCDEGYNSSSYASVQCDSDECRRASYISCGDCDGTPGIGCSKNGCYQMLGNTVVQYWTGSQIGQDVVSIRSTDGKHPGPYVSAHRFIFTCGNTMFLEGLAKGAKGMLGLGRTQIALPLQLADVFNFRMKFAVCLPSSTATTSKGVVFFGDGPYVMRPNIDISSSLTYTPMIINPFSSGPRTTSGERGSEYFIGIKSIKINERTIKLNATLLTLSRNGHGGSQFSTVTPYTVMETSIYKAFTKAFVKASKSMNLTRVASTRVDQFEFCFSSKNFASTRVGPTVPTIDLVLQSEHVYWRIFGENSMVRVNKDVICLGFLQGRSDARTSIVIGGYQLENNLLQFDLRNSMIGFSSSLLSRETSCSNFNFTSSA